MRDVSKKPQLAANSLDISQSIIMGTAGAAPTFSVSIAAATMIASVHIMAPASVLYCGLLIFSIALAFIHLNKISVNAGASYAWISLIFGRPLGLFTGWTILVCSAVFMVSGSIPTATATLLLVAPHHINDLNWVILTAACWLTIISAINFKGMLNMKLYSLMQLKLRLSDLKKTTAFLFRQKEETYFKDTNYRG